MEVRDATPGDVEVIERLAPEDIDARRLVLDRRVLVAEDSDGIVGFLSYDTWAGAVHVSALAGDPAVLEDLLSEPRRFAEQEDLSIEIVVPDSDTRLQSALETAGFEPIGAGPAFHGDGSKRYRDETGHLR